MEALYHVANVRSARGSGNFPVLRELLRNRSVAGCIYGSLNDSESWSHGRLMIRLHRISQSYDGG
jgi:hypothetical protein